MKLSVTLLSIYATLVATVSAYTVTGGSVALNKEPLFEVNAKSADTQRLTLDSPKDTISLEVDISASSQPHQLMFLLSNGRGLDHPVFCSFKNGRASADISVNRLPSALKQEERIFVNFVAADAGKGAKNVNLSLVELIPSDALKDSVSYEKPARLGASAEIHHVFKEDSTTVNAVIPLVFSGAAVVLLLVLLGSWASVLKTELFTATQGSTWKAGLLATLGYFEFTVAKYYLGASIFTTIFHAVLLAGPFLFFGSRALTVLGRQRKDGRA